MTVTGECIADVGASELDLEPIALARGVIRAELRHRHLRVRLQLVRDRADGVARAACEPVARATVPVGDVVVVEAGGVVSGLLGDRVARVGCDRHLS